MPFENQRTLETFFADEWALPRQQAPKRKNRVRPSRTGIDNEVVWVPIAVVLSDASEEKASDGVLVTDDGNEVGRVRPAVAASCSRRRHTCSGRNAVCRATGRVHSFPSAQDVKLPFPSSTVPSQCRAFVLHLKYGFFIQDFVFRKTEALISPQTRKKIGPRRYHIAYSSPVINSEGGDC
jgi:hypothetical protein